MEGESFFVMTTTDSILSAAVAFEEGHGTDVNIYGIRKAAEIKEFKEAI